MSAIFLNFDSSNIARKLVRDKLSKVDGIAELSLDGIIEFLEAGHYLLSYSEDDVDYNLGLAVICHVSQCLPDDSLARLLLLDCISASRNFLYLNMLKEFNKGFDIQLNPIEQFQLQHYQTDENATLTKQQKEILGVFKREKRVVVSAPTSFGKTRILQEIILQQNYSKVAIIMPTLALIAETVSRFQEDKRFSNYGIINSTSVLDVNEKSIFVLTPEKMDLLLEARRDVRFDFFSFDEIYKIQDDRDRRPVFANVLYRMMLMGSDFYLIGPYFKEFSPAFIRRAKAKFLHFSTEIVQKDIIPLYAYDVNSSFDLDGEKIEKSSNDKTTLKRVVKALKEQQLIYHNTRFSVESLAKNVSHGKARYSSPLIDYIKETISESWTLVYCLERGVAFHHGSMPRFVQNALVQEFNLGENINTLVCTTTLTEGVNTTAKNVIVFSKMKGTDTPLTGFDYKNIKGRAGRFLHHFVGRVITFHDVKESERDSVDFYYFDDTVLESDEVLNIEEADLNPKSLEVRKRTLDVLLEESIPEAVVKKNKYIAIEKQISLVNYLRENPSLLRSLMFNGNLPTKEQLTLIVSLLFERIFNARDFGNRSFQLGNLSRLINFYIFRKPTVRELIYTQNGASVNTKIRNAFFLISHYFEFSLPKYFNCFEGLVNFVALEMGLTEKVNFGFLVMMFQYGFTNPNEIALKEFGLPDDVIRKLSEKTGDCRNMDEIRLRFRMRPDLIETLEPFEKTLLKKLL